jgi:hypothetical protein
MKFLFAICLALIPWNLFAQKDTVYLPEIKINASKMPDKESLFTILPTTLQISPLAPPGMDKKIYQTLCNHVFNHVKYPEMLIEAGIEDYLQLGFSIQKNGTITGIKLVKEGVYLLNNHVLDVFSNLPVFTNSNISKDVYCIWPFNFRILEKLTNGPITSIQSLKGDWTCVDRKIFIAQEAYISDAWASNLRVDKGEVMFFEYPCYFTDKITMNRDMDTPPTFFKSAYFKNDTLIIQLPENSVTSGYRYYVRDQFDEITICQLMRDTLNLACLTGLWYLEKEHPDEIEYGQPIQVHYPVYMPPVYKLDKTDIKDKNTLMLNINGKLQSFQVLYFSMYESYFELESGPWSKVKFRAKYFTRERAYNHGWKDQ